jgi:hypothetical protein
MRSDTLQEEEIEQEKHLHFLKILAITGNHPMVNPIFTQDIRPLNVIRLT